MTSGVALSLRKLLVLVGVPVDVLTMDEAIDRLEDFVIKGRRTGRSFQIATVNTDFIVNAVRDPETRWILQEADMAVADGMPVVWCARWLGCNLKERVAGADLIPRLAERAAQHGFSIYFLGAAPGVAARASQILSERYPGLKVAGVCSPPYVSILEMDAGICEAVRQADPDIRLVAFGNPKQEKWIAMYKNQLGVPVQIGVGGTLDFITQETSRAPAWMQRNGLEWLHRLLHNPKRLWQRYVEDFFVFGFLFVQQWWTLQPWRRLKLKKWVPVQGLAVDQPVLTGNAGLLQLKGTLTVENMDATLVQAVHLLEETSSLVVDLSRVVFLDSAAIGTLLHIAKEARAQGGDLSLVSVPDPIRQTLALLRLDHFFRMIPSLDDTKNEAAAHFEANPGLETSQITQPDGTTWKVIAAPHRLDANSAPDLKARGAAVLASRANLLVDMRDTVFLASMGLAVLAQFHRTADETGQRFALMGCQDDVLRVLRLVRFDNFLTLYPTDRDWIWL